MYIQDEITSKAVQNPKKIWKDAAKKQLKYL